MAGFRLSDRILSSSPSSTVGIADKVKRLRSQGEEVFDFSAGRAFEPTPDYVSEAAIVAMRAGDTHQTMAKGTASYRAACATKLQRENNVVANPEKEIIATMGAKQGLTISLLATINPGDEVIVEDPCFVSYKQTIHYLGGQAVTVPLRSELGWLWDANELEDSITAKTKVILLCTPQNPTGVVHSREYLETIANLAIKHNLVVITDEVYERTVWGENKHLNVATLPEMKARTITIMSLTKSFSMGGWRIGFIYTCEEIASQLEKLQQHLITSPNSFVQAGAERAFSLEPQQVVLDYWKEWETKVESFTDTLDAMDGINCYMPQGGFYAWADISSFGLSSEEFAARLLTENKVALVAGSSFGDQGEGYIRVTCVKTRKEVKGGLEAIRSFVSKLS